MITPNRYPLRTSRPASTATLTMGLLVLLLAACGPSDQPSGELARSPSVSDPQPVGPQVVDGWLEREGVKLRVDVRGEGEPTLVLVHGNGSNRRAWKHQVEHFASGHRMVTFDLRGMGESGTAADGDYSVPAMTADLEAVVDALDLPPFVLVGHSYGGSVVATYAGRHPERLRALVYVDVGGNWVASEEEKQQLAESLAPERYEQFTEAWFGQILQHATEPTHQEVMAGLRSTPREVFIGAIEGLQNYDLEGAQAAYPGPRFAIVAQFLDRDTALQRRIEMDQVHVLPEVSHWLMLDAPDEVNRLLGELVGGLVSVVTPE